MRLDAYRGGSTTEKRDVLSYFWRRDVDASARIRSAARQYGPWGLVCCIVLVLEPLPVLVLSRGHLVILLAAGAVEGVALPSLWWAMVRVVTLRRQVTT